MPRAKRYNDEILLNCIQRIKPTGRKGWLQVSIAYQEATQEEQRRDAENLKRYFLTSLCKSGKKPPTGSAQPDEMTRRAIEIYDSLLLKENAKSLGFQHSEDENEANGDASDEDDEDDDFEGQAEQGTSARKRKCSNDFEENLKTKNSRPARNPRGGTAQAISTLVGAVASNLNAQETTMDQTLKMMNMMMMMHMMKALGMDMSSINPMMNPMMNQMMNPMMNPTMSPINNTTEGCSSSGVPNSDNEQTPTTTLNISNEKEDDTVDDASDL